MRVKLIVLAVGAALAAFALVWGSEAVSNISTPPSPTTLAGSTGAADAGERDEIPNIMKGGLGEVNKNLSELKNNVQTTMDERPDRVDEQVERAK